MAQQKPDGVGMGKEGVLGVSWELVRTYNLQKFYQQQEVFADGAYGIA